MKCPNTREAWVLNVGDLPVRIVDCFNASHLVKALQKLFTGFSSSYSCDVDAELAVSYEPSPIRNQIFDVEPVNMNKAGPFLKERLLQKVRSLYPFGDQENLYVIGFLNGLLVYRHQSRRGHCHIFQAEQGHHFLVGSLHKLLFVFLCLIMAERQRFFIHGAAIQNGQKGYIFWGPSGAGKTTIAGFSERDHVFSDDAPVLLKYDGVFCCAPSPFQQLEMSNIYTIATERRAPVSKNLFLHKASEIRMADKSGAVALSEIITGHLHCFEFMRSDLRKAAFHFMYDYCCGIPAYDLYFTKDGNFWKLVTGEIASEDRITQ